MRAPQTSVPINVEADEMLAASATRGRARLKDYIAIARLDHSTKHIFIVPGVVLACLLRGIHAPSFAGSLICGLVAAVCIASANYVINEFLDREFDRHHPTKCGRAGVQRELNETWVGLEWLTLVMIGLLVAALSSKTMLLATIVFALQGVVYNVRPLRSKDHAFLDVISESINNPLRLTIGWSMVDPTTLPPGSLILAYWFGGAFLMAAKRLSEYRELASSDGKDRLVRYRASFAGYSEASLTVSCLSYALLSCSSLVVFLIKYRVEYILLLPAVTALFGYYLAMSMRADSAAQRPEKLYREPGLILIVAALSLLFVVTSAIDMPLLYSVTEQHFIVLE